MECNPFNISTGEHESFTFLEIILSLFFLFILIFVCIQYSRDEGLLLLPGSCAEVPATRGSGIGILGLWLCTDA